MAHLTLVDIARRTVPGDRPMAKKWMKKAFANAHGQFKAKAERAGKSTKAFAESVLSKNSHASTKTKRQAALAERGMEANHNRHKRWYGPKE